MQLSAGQLSNTSLLLRVGGVRQAADGCWLVGDAEDTLSEEELRALLPEDLGPHVLRAAPTPSTPALTVSPAAPVLPLPPALLAPNPAPSAAVRVSVVVRWAAAGAGSEAESASLSRVAVPAPSLSDLASRYRPVAWLGDAAAKLRIAGEPAWGPAEAADGGAVATCSFTLDLTPEGIEPGLGAASLLIGLEAREQEGEEGRRAEGGKASAAGAAALSAPLPLLPPSLVRELARLSPASQRGVLSDIAETLDLRALGAAASDPVRQAAASLSGFAAGKGLKELGGLAQRLCQPPAPPVPSSNTHTATAASSAGFFPDAASEEAYLDRSMRTTMYNSAALMSIRISAMFLASRSLELYVPFHPLGVAATVALQAMSVMAARTLRRVPRRVASALLLLQALITTLSEFPYAPDICRNVHDQAWLRLPFSVAGIPSVLVFSVANFESFYLSLATRLVSVAGCWAAMTLVPACAARAPQNPWLPVVLAVAHGVAEAVCRRREAARRGAAARRAVAAREVRHLEKAESLGGAADGKKMA